MIPIYKLGSLFIRIFSRPMSSRIKRLSVNNNSYSTRFARRCFIVLGNKYNVIEVFVNRKIMGIPSEEIFVKPLTDELALQKGAEFFSEFFVYGCLLGLPIYELYRQGRDNETKKEQLNGRLNSMENQIQEAKQIHTDISTKIHTISTINQNMSQQISTIQDKLNIDKTNDPATLINSIKQLKEELSQFNTNNQ